MNRASQFQQAPKRSDSQKLRRKQLFRKYLVSELLEPRSMMAGDIVLPADNTAFPFWNPARPSDVNNDTHVDIRDILGLVGDFNANGFRNLNSSGTAQGGVNGETVVSTNNSTSLLLDVNRDGSFTITDLLRTVQDFQASGESFVASMRVTATPVGIPVDAQIFSPGSPPTPGYHTDGEVNFNPGNTSTGYNSTLFPTLTDKRSETFGSNQVAVIDKGDKFELRVFVQDLVDTTTAGLFISPFDVAFNTKQVAPIVNESQELILNTDTVLSGGTFTISFNGNTQTVTGTSSLTTMTNRVTAAMNTLAGGSTNVTVERFDPPGFTQNTTLYPPDGYPDNIQYNWKITFKGALEGQNVSKLVVDTTLLTNSGSTTITSTVNEFNGAFNGTSTNGSALKNAVLAAPGQSSTGSKFYTDLIKTVRYTPDNTGDKPDGLHEIQVGANILPTTYAGIIEREYVYIPMQSIDGTTNATGAEVPMDISLNKPEINSPANWPVGSGNPAVIPTASINYNTNNPFKLVVREYVTALGDVFTTTNAGSPTAGQYSLNVLQDNGNGADFSRTTPTATPFALATSGQATQGKLSTGGTGGTITRLSGTQLGYTPPAGYSIASTTSGPGIIDDTFTYVINATDSNAGKAAYMDTATVTVKLFAPNAAPLNTIAATYPAVGEGSAATLTGVSVADSDNNGSTNITVTVTVTDGNDQPVFGSFVIGANTVNTTDTITMTSSVTAINSALASNIVFTPDNVNFNGTLKFTLETNDNGSGAGAPLSDRDVATVTVNAVNDQPIINDVPGTSTMFDEDQFNFGIMSLTDVDVNEGSGSHQLTLTITATHNGSSSLKGTFTGTFTNLTTNTNTTGQIQLTGPIADLNTAIGTLRYIADQTGNFLGLYNMNVQVSDNGNYPGPTPLNNSSSFSLTINAAARPRAIDDTATVTEEQSTTTIDVLTNDKIHPGGTKTVITNSIANIVATPSSAISSVYTLPGTLPANLVTQSGNVISVDASLLPDFFGTIEFDYGLADGVGVDANSDPVGHVVVTVTNVADAPRRNATAVTSLNGTEETQISIDLSSYFFDPDGDAITPVLVTESPTTTPQGTFGSLLINGVQYTPPANFNATKTLSFNVTDGTLTSSGTADIPIAFANTPDAPVVQSFTIPDFNEDPVTQPVAISLAGKITDVDGGVIDLANLINLSVTPSAAGTVVGTATGLDFTPTLNFNGAVKIDYQIKDGDFPANTSLNSNVGSITFTINPVNDAPVAVDDTDPSGTTFSAGEGQTIDFDVVANDSDVDAVSPAKLEPNTQLLIVTGPGLGSASVVGGKIRYVAPALVPTSTTTTLTYKLNDRAAGGGGLDSNIATLTIKLEPKNDAPVIGTTTLSKSVNEDPSSPLSFNLFTDANVTDSDTAQSKWTVEIVTAPLHGTLSGQNVAGNGVITYTPASNYNGPDSFVYRISDNDTIAPANLKSGNGTVNITVNETNDAPVANNDTQSNGIGLVISNFSNAITNIIDVRANDNTAVDTVAQDGELKLVFVGFGATSGTTEKGGTVTITADGKVNYVAPNLPGDFTDSFTYTIQDRNGTGLTASATASFLVQEAVPVTLNIDVFCDKSASANTLGDGFRQADETGFANVPVSIIGTDFRGTAVNIPNLFTDARGKLTVDRLLPGTYRVKASQPAMIQDGNDSSPDIVQGSNYVVYDKAADAFDLNIPVIPTTVTDNVIDLFFGEVGVAPTFRTIEDLLMSAGRSGFNLGVTANGNVTWYEALPGWNNVASVTGTLSPDRTSLTLFITPTTGGPACQLDLTLTGVNRFRMLRPDANGNMCLRIDCPPDFFGPAFAAKFGTPAP